MNILKIMICRMMKLMPLTSAPSVLFTGISLTFVSPKFFSLNLAHIQEIIQNVVFVNNARLNVRITTFWKGSNVYRYLKKTFPPKKMKIAAINALEIHSVSQSPSKSI